MPERGKGGDVSDQKDELVIFSTAIDIHIELPRPTPFGWIALCGAIIVLIALVLFLIFRNRNSN